MGRPLTGRERAVLEALLSVEFDGVEQLRAQLAAVDVIGGCDCGCPSIDFYSEPGAGMDIRVNAGVVDSADGLFLYTVAGRLGGIDYLAGSDGADPEELPDPARLRITPAPELR